MVAPVVRRAEEDAIHLLHQALVPDPDVVQQVFALDMKGRNDWLAEATGRRDGLDAKVEGELHVNYVLRRDGRVQDGGRGPCKRQSHLAHDVVREGNVERPQHHLPGCGRAGSEDGDGVPSLAEQIGETAGGDHRTIGGIIPRIDDHRNAQGTAVHLRFCSVSTARRRAASCRATSAYAT